MTPLGVIAILFLVVMAAAILGHIDRAAKARKKPPATKEDQ